MHGDAERSASRSRILILGIGNRLLGDDGVGSCFAEALSSLKLPNWIKVVDGGLGGIELLEEVEGSDILFIVDSVSPEDALGGRVRVYKVNELSLNPEEIARVLSEVGGHGVTSEVLIAIALALKKLPEETYVVGIVPSAMELGDHLSDEAKEGCIKALEAIKSILRENRLIVEVDVKKFVERLNEIC